MPLDLPTIAAAGVLAYACAIILHEAAHLLTGFAVGGVPELISSTDVRGNWSRVRDVGFVMIGVSGSLMNAVLALAGWLVFRSRVGRPDTTALVAWAFFAVNTWMPALYLVGSPMIGFGDWMTVFEHLPNTGILRVTGVLSGLFVVGVLRQGTLRSIAQLTGNGPAPERMRRAALVTRTLWAAGVLVAFAASLFSPLTLLWAVPIAVSSSAITTLPLLFIAMRVGGEPVPGAPLRVERSWGVIVAGVMAGAALVGVFGPGVAFGG